MAPLILHNVPDEELFVGEDGVQRPYAVVFPSTDGHQNTSRTRRNVPETGSFGKSTRRSRSKTGTPARREDPTLKAGEDLFAQYISNLSNQQPESPQRKASLPSSASQPNLSSQITAPLAPIDSNANSSNRYVHKVPTEVILRGYQSNHQYAAIKQFESIAGRICEDYSRDPPLEQRRYKSDLRDPTSLRTRPLTLEEKAKALRFAGGDNWIKVTFESAEAAESAVWSSPQTILGYLVYAEPYRGLPPSILEAVPANGSEASNLRRDRSTRTSQTIGPSNSSFAPRADRRSGLSALPRSFTTPDMREIGRDQIQSISPPGSHTSSNTLDTGTLSTATISSATITSTQTLEQSTANDNSQEDSTSLYCRKIPTARRIQLLPATEALLPQPSLSKRLISKIPVIGWLGSDIIGNEIPRTEEGDFDWTKATFYWKLQWFLDKWVGMHSGELAGPASKED